MYLSAKEKFCYPLLALVTILWISAFSLLGMDLHHDGIMFKAAADAAAGKWLFKEIFCQYGILTPLVQGAVLKIAGVELAALKIAAAVVYGGIILLSDLLWRRFLSLPGRLLNGVMFFVLAPYLFVPFHIWSSVYALFFMLLGTEFFLLGLEKEKSRFFVFSGICAMAAFGFRWPCGVVTLLAALIVCGAAAFAGCRAFQKTFFPFLAGGGAVALLFALYLTAGGAWHDFFRQTFSFVGKFAWERGGSGSFYRLAETFFPHGETMNFIFSFIPLGALGLFFFCIRKFFKTPAAGKEDISLIALLVFGLAAWHQYYPVPCVRHLYWGALPLFGAYAFLIEKIARTPRFDKVKKGLFLFLLFLPLVWGGALRMYGGVFRLSEFFSRKAVDLPGVRYIRHGRGEAFICRFAQDLHRNMPPALKARGVFNYTADGIWSVILPPFRHFEHPMFVNWQNDVYADYPAKALACISTHKPAVLASTPFFHPEYIQIAEFQYMGVTYRLFVPRS